jgi:hypothetical protein
MHYNWLDADAILKIVIIFVSWKEFGDIVDPSWKGYAEYPSDCCSVMQTELKELHRILITYNVLHITVILILLRILVGRYN